MFGLYWGSWAACLPAIQQQTGASDAQLGLGLLCVALASLPLMLAAGRLADGRLGGAGGRGSALSIVAILGYPGSWSGRA